MTSGRFFSEAKIEADRKWVKYSDVQIEYMYLSVVVRKEGKNFKLRIC